MWIEDLANYVRSLSLPGIANNVFLYTLKENDVGAMFTTRGGGLQSLNEIPNYYKGPLQLIVRSASPQDSQSQILAIINALDSTQKRAQGLPIGLNLQTVQFNYIYANSFPLIYPRSDGDFYEASVNFDVCFVALS